MPAPACNSIRSAVDQCRAQRDRNVAVAGAVQPAKAAAVPGRPHFAVGPSQLRAAALASRRPPGLDTVAGDQVEQAQPARTSTVILLRRWLRRPAPRARRQPVGAAWRHGRGRRSQHRRPAIAHGDSCRRPANAIPARRCSASVGACLLPVQSYQRSGVAPTKARLPWP